MRDFARAVYRAWQDKPTAVTLPLGMVLIGANAMILGDRASRAFTDLGGSTIIRLAGLAMFACGVLVASGIALSDATYEVIGLALGVFGSAIYGAGVILGLGTQGLITGPENLLIALAFLGRIALLLRRARSAAREE